MSTPTVPIERHTRSRDPETSWSAAEISAANWSELKAAIVLIMATNGPLTDEELFDRYVSAGFPTRTPQRLRTARKELQLAGDVLLSDVLGRTRGGYWSQKWVLA